VRASPKEEAFPETLQAKKKLQVWLKAMAIEQGFRTIMEWKQKATVRLK
jgi:hypothetical protein